MKQIQSYITLASLAALALAAASCSNDGEPRPEFDSTRYITFDTPCIDPDATVGDFATTGRRTTSRSRASVNDEITAFRVWGYCVPANGTPAQARSKWDDKSTFFTAGPDLRNLNGQTVTVNGSYTYYNNYTPTPWNSDVEALHSFIAVAGDATYTMENAVATTGSERGPRLTIDLGLTGASTTTDLDYMRQPNVMIASTFDHESVDGRVPMSFMHIMTGLRFCFHNYSSDDLIIRRVTFSGTFFRRAVYTFTTDDPVLTVPTDQTYSGRFTLLSAPQTIPSGASDYMGTDPDDPTTLMLLPNPAGTIEPDGNFTIGSHKEIRIDYTVNGKEGTFVQGDNFTLNYKPQPNVLYTANFSFVGDQFLVMFQAENSSEWENGGDSSITIH